MAHEESNKRGVFNRCEMLWVCNVFATTFRVIPDFPVFHGYANVNFSYARDNLSYFSEKIITKPRKLKVFRALFFSTFRKRLNPHVQI